MTSPSAPGDPFGSSTRPTPTVLDARPAHPGRIRLAGLVLVTALGGDAWQSLLGWPAFIVLVVALAGASIVSLIRDHALQKLPLARYSKPLLAFLVLCTVSIIWSHYPG